MTIGIYLATVGSLLLATFAVFGVISGIRAIREGDTVWGVMFMTYTGGAAALFIPLLWAVAWESPL